MEEPFKVVYQLKDELATCEMIAETMCEIAKIKKDKWKDSYKIGDMITPEYHFNNNPTKACASGIHFYSEKENAGEFVINHYNYNDKEHICDAMNNIILRHMYVSDFQKLILEKKKMGL